MMPETNVLYHASAQHGIRVFTPRRCWFSPDWCKSGMLDEGANLPLGMIEVFAFFAGTRDFVSYFFAPPRIKRFAIERVGRNFATGLQLLGLEDYITNRVLVFEDKDRDRSRNHSFSLYEFDATQFRRLPTEYIAEKPVTPIREILLSDATLQIERSGIKVVFVPDIEACYRKLFGAGIQFCLLAGIITPSLDMLDRTATEEIGKMADDKLIAAFQEHLRKGKEFYSSVVPGVEAKPILAAALQHFMRCEAAHRRLLELKMLQSQHEEEKQQASMLRDDCIKMISTPE